MSQPTFDVIRNLPIALQVSADALIFDEDERSPSDDLKLQFEAVSRFPEEEKLVVKALLEKMILKHEPNAGPTPEPNKKESLLKKAVKSFSLFDPPTG